MYDKYTEHQLGSGCILVQLPQPYMLSSMRILLWELDADEYVFYKYTIEVSVNKKEWKMVANKTNKATRSWQLLNFDPTPIVFIRITGVYSSDGDEFRCVYLEAPAQVKLDFDDDYDDSDDTNVSMSDESTPKYNVTSTTNGANVIKGENNGFETNMLLHSYKPRKRHKYYTWHKLESGCIRIQLAQPYILSSMRILLWEYSAKNYVFYKYTVEVSVNNEDWKRVANKTDKATRSWQLLEFDPTPIVFIRIIGVHSSDGDEFRCVYLEAPVLITIDSNRYLEDGSRETDVFVSDASSSSG
ncbi:BTB/POZ domain-containing protein 9-like [Adelges cooleyi]|uniref:BTB/POZ domain-containing protein 9-like n=1 Tax=Adelges cooleyi TaxID=133065 RepID=UPI00218092BE|nr:BTB/POZ domain-containing protein 9-like [Adelges cooleyi]